MRPELSSLSAEQQAKLEKLRRGAVFWAFACLLSGLVAFSGNFLPDEWLYVPIAGLVVFLATMWPAYRSNARHDAELRRCEAIRIAADQVGSIEQAPVLYLRSFDDDQRAARIKGAKTEEEHLGMVLSQIGPFVAIGRPGELLPELGAARVYVENERWKSTVEDLVRRARLVVIRTGRTMGLDWEIEQAVRLLRPQQLVLLVDNARELKGVLERIGSLHPRARTRSWMGWRSIGSIRGFIVFDDEWRASVLRARGPGLYFFCMNEGGVGHATKRLAWTLRPLFRRLGMRWQRPSPNWGLIILSAIAAGLFLSAIVAEILDLQHAM